MQILMPDSIVFERFQILEKEGIVGAGGQSLIYKAIDLSAPNEKPWLRDVCLKQYHDLIPGTNESKALKQHFDDLLKRLKEKENYICLPLFLGEAFNSIIAVYPWVKGKTLRDILRNSSLNHDERARIAIALIKTVRMIHKQEIIHLDLKPSNIVVEKNPKDRQYYIRIIDLDAAQIDGKGLRKNIIGSVGYMSPEHCFSQRFGDVSNKSDIFSLGIILFEVLFHNSPYDCNIEYQDAIIDEKFNVPENDYHKEIVDIVLQCLVAKAYLRPEASWILSAFMRHYDTSLEAVHSDDRWTIHEGKIVYFQIEHDFESGEFYRTYYESVVLDRNQLRGSGVSLNSGAIIKICIDSNGGTLIVLDDAIDIKIDRYTPLKGENFRLSSLHKLSIGSVKFLIKKKFC